MESATAPTFVYVLLITSFLLICSVLSSKISTKVGVPTLLLFLGIGMLSGSEGPGGIAFSDYSISYAVGSICLAIIMFDGGIRTDWESVRPILSTGASLSFFGTVFTAIITSVFAHLAFDLPGAEAFLLGSIVSSTDAAAVFSILKSKNLTLKGPLKKLLEFEAGSNDPTAIFLTISTLTYIMTPDAGFFLFLKFFFLQAVLGLLFGLLAGKGIQWLINNVGIEYEGLYSVLLLGLVCLLFAATTLLGGSGFLAVYVAGIVLGNLKILHKESIIRFQDGIAWIAQITVFLTLGLLVFPSSLLEVWKEGILLALFLMFVSRPVSVLISGQSKAFSWREKTLVSWVGLRGAAPIILATLPWDQGHPRAEYFFDLVFFVVLITVLFQGLGIPWLAEKLQVTAPMDEEVPHDFSQELLPAGFITIEINVTSGAPALDDRIVDLALPSGVLLTSLKRDGRFLIPKGETVIRIGDRIRGLARPSCLGELENVFGSAKVIG